MRKLTDADYYRIEDAGKIKFCDYHREKLQKICEDYCDLWNCNRTKHNYTNIKKHCGKILKEVEKQKLLLHAIAYGKAPLDTAFERVSDEIKFQYQMVNGGDGLEFIFLLQKYSNLLRATRKAVDNLKPIEGSHYKPLIYKLLNMLGFLFEDTGREIKVYRNEYRGGRYCLRSFCQRDINSASA
jgi:hypothetical protein